MEDFTGAYIERKRDTSVLLALQSDHSIAIFHLGGIAIECRLKALIILYHNLHDWKHKSRRQGDDLFDTSIKNPSHRLIEAIQSMPILYDKAKMDAAFLQHLSNIINPLGTSESDYISLRYSSKTEQPLDGWQKSFNYVCGWLDQNMRFI